MYHDLARIWFQNNARSQIRTTKDLGLFLPKILWDIFTRGVAIYMYRRASNVATCTEEVAMKQLGFLTAELDS